MEQASAAAIDGLFMALPQDLKSESVIRMLPLLTEEQRAGVIDKIEQLGHNGLPVKRQRVSTGEDGDEDGKGAISLRRMPPRCHPLYADAPPDAGLGPRMERREMMLGPNRLTKYEDSIWSILELSPLPAAIRS